MPHGLNGAIVVEPKNPTVHYDRDYTLVLHEWRLPGNCFGTCPELLMMGPTTATVSLTAKPGELIRVRIVSGGDDGHTPALIGAPFKVIAIDGHDVNGPTPLQNEKLALFPGQRNDISFVMPVRGPVVLLDGDTRAVPANQHPLAVFGEGAPNVSYPDNWPQFDFTSYGAPTADPITLDTAFSMRYDMLLDNQLGFYNGGFTMRFTIGGQTYPNIPSIRVIEGDVVKIHIVDNGPIPHAMHLHGHVLTVLAHNGRPLTGSPIHLDTLTVLGGESYDVAFAANNPGLWMLHCHFLVHDAQGMDMMVTYPNIFTPYMIGPASGNNPF